MGSATSLHGEILRRFAAASVLDGRLPCDFYGTASQLKAFSEALYATREFDRVLASSEDLHEATRALQVKRAAAARFRRELGIHWPG